MANSRKPKRVLIFSLAYHPRLGGAEIAVGEITDRIPPDEIVFDMVTLRFDSRLPKREQVGNVAVHRIGFSKKNPTVEDLVRFPMYLNKIFFPVIAFLKAVSLDRRHSYDALWALMSYMAFPAFFFKLFYRRRVPYLLTLQDGDSLEHITGRLRVRLFLKFLKRAFRRAEFVQTISHYLADFARNMGYAGPLAVIPNGVNVRHFSKDYNHKELEALRKKLTDKTNIPNTEYRIPNIKFIITASRLVSKNATDDVIRALQYIPEHVSFLILGEGPDEEKLRTLAEEKKVRARVHFLGHIGHNELPKYLKLSSVFVRPSLSEGLGSSFLEAMAAGVPIVGTPVGGILDFLEDGTTGLFCDVRSPKSIAEKVSRLLEDEELSRRLSDNARRLVEEKYSWDLITKYMMEKVFQKLLQR